MKKLLLALLALVAVLTGCGDDADYVVRVNGSTSVEEFFNETLAPAITTDLGYEVEYQATGSSDGVNSVLNSTSPFGTASREIKQEELDTAAEAGMSLDVDVLAYDGIAVVTAKDNPVTDLTLEQVRQIFTGEITNWSEVGGNDANIVVVSREDGSGTRGAFEEIVGYEGELVADALISKGNGDVANTVSTNPNAIGYVSFTTLDSNADKLNGLNVDGGEPIALHVLDGSYPISRPFNLVTNPDELSSQDQEVLEWIKDTGRTLAPDAGLIEYTE